jgi:mediator of RNA polymerase II transcription subunit 12
LGDTGRRRQTINTKDNFWLVVGKNKPAVDNWFRDLANAQKPYSQLLRKVPIFNKKEEVLMTLCEHQVASSRAVWYIKMSAAYALVSFVSHIATAPNLAGIRSYDP